MRTAEAGLLRPRKYHDELVREQVSSFTTPGTVYQVRQLADGSWDCDCPDARCRQHDCKHIVWVRDRKRGQAWS